MKVLAFVFLLLTSGSAFAQVYPAKPIKIKSIAPEEQRSAFEKR